MLLLSVTVLVVLAVSSESALLPVSGEVHPTRQCVHNKKVYAIGEKTPDVCQPCTCTPSGFMACMVIDCMFYMPCVDAIRKPGVCCQTCPNGRNCKHESHVIKDGDVYRPDAHTECRCKPGFNMGPKAHEAICTKTAI